MWCTQRSVSLPGIVYLSLSLLNPDVVEVHATVLNKLELLRSIHVTNKDNG